MLRAVIFDMDDTLIDWSQRSISWQEISNHHLQPLHEHLTGEGHSVPDMPGLVESYIEAATAVWESVSPPNWDSPRQEDILRKMFASLKLDPSRLDIDYMTRLFAWGAVPGVVVFPDVIDVLEELTRHNIKLGLLTNAAQPMWMRDRELESFGLKHYFKSRLTAGDVGTLKPHPKPFQAVLEALGVQADEALYVGDRLHDDVVGAQAAGMRAVWIRRVPSATTSEYVRPNAIIDRMNSLLNTLDLWYPGWRKKDE